MQDKIKSRDLGYNPKILPKELKSNYISITPAQKDSMLKSIGIKSSKELFKTIPSDVQFSKTPSMCEKYDYQSLLNKMENIAAKNNPKTCFIGDGLKNYKVHEIVPFVSNIRGLTTAYTPYQPERSQGTLHSLWIYSSLLAKMTGFEAINASLYDRSTCLFEACMTACRLKKKMTILISEGIYPGDLEVINTLKKETKLKVITIPIDAKSGGTDLNQLADIITSNIDHLAGMAFSQINCLGILEDVNKITDLCEQYQLQKIAVVDPMTIVTDGLIAPSEYGSKKLGADMIVAEGQHIAIGPNFGGPGLGIFGIRYNQDNKKAIRSTAGRFIGKTIDSVGDPAFSIVLSTREQHIRREKATSNICSNQSFIATLAGAAILGRGEKGMQESLAHATAHAAEMALYLSNFAGIDLAFNNAAILNEFTICLTDSKCDDLLQKAQIADIHLGVNVSNRVSGDRELLLLSFFDIHTKEDIKKLKSFFNQHFKTAADKLLSIATINQELKRLSKLDLPNFTYHELCQFYLELGEQNVGPDDCLYPLGSCTMKYNPYINDYTAGLKGFTDLHPQAPLTDAQGSLEVLYEIQEIFKQMTGLSAVTTQPVAGAQGELVGLKIFQAYHRDHGQEETRNIILIPQSAHGTNPATATMAGFESKKIAGITYGIINIKANTKGHIDLEHFDQLITEYAERIAAIMITNPNTSGLFEKDFTYMSQKIHQVGGLVYMDGANMNAIAGIVNISAMGVDAIHNNLHKTWSIPHGGGGPGDAIVAVSQRCADYLPGQQIVKNTQGEFTTITPVKSIGSIHRHWGNFAHKVRCLTYLYALGSEGIVEMSQIAVLSSQYLFENLKNTYPLLPNNRTEPRLHEFIITLEEENFALLAKNNIPKAQAIAKIGKLFLDFGLHSPTVAFPEMYGLMIEPTESYSKDDLDKFIKVMQVIKTIICEHPQVLQTVPHFTPVEKINEVYANKNLQLSEAITELPIITKNKISVAKLLSMPQDKIIQLILEAHQTEIQKVASSKK